MPEQLQPLHPFGRANQEVAQPHFRVDDILVFGTLDRPCGIEGLPVTLFCSAPVQNRKPGIGDLRVQLRQRSLGLHVQSLGEMRCLGKRRDCLREFRSQPVHKAYQRERLDQAVRGR